MQAKHHLGIKTSITARAANGQGIKTGLESEHSSQQGSNGRSLPAPVSSQPSSGSSKWEEKSWSEREGLDMVWPDPPKPPVGEKQAVRGESDAVFKSGVRHKGLPKHLLDANKQADALMCDVEAQRNASFQEERRREKGRSRRDRLIRLFGETDEDEPTPRSFWKAQKAAKSLRSHRQGRGQRGPEKEAEFA